MLDDLRTIADELDATPAQIALRWVIGQQLPVNDGMAMVPVMGARTRDQLTENARAVEVDLTDEHLNRIDNARSEPFEIQHWPVA